MTLAQSFCLSYLLLGKEIAAWRIWKLCCYSCVISSHLSAGLQKPGSRIWEERDVCFGLVFDNAALFIFVLFMIVLLKMVMARAY